MNTQVINDFKTNEMLNKMIMAIESFDEDTNQNDDETSENVDDVMNEIFPNKEN